MVFNMIAGGASLNFGIVGNNIQPTNPNENTLWVKTEAEITGWAFSYEEPTPKEGMVWIIVGSASSAKFNALKNGCIMVYPISAKQYVNGVWIDKEAMSYQNGTWNTWVTYLFKNGEQYEDVTGGWSNSISNFDSDNWYCGPAIGPENSSVVIGNSIKVNVLHSSNVNYNEAAAVGTRNKIDMTGRKRIKATCNLQKKTGSRYDVARMAVHTSLVTPYDDPQIDIPIYVDIPEGESVVELDVSEVLGNFHVIFGGLSGSVGYELTVSEVKIE